MKISIVDDHQMFVDGLVSIISQFPDVNLVFTANNGKEFLNKLQYEVAPDLVLMDINMPEMNGLELAEVLMTKHPKMGILVLSMLDNGQQIKKMIDLGVKGYILKNTGRDELYKAMMCVFRGESYFSKAVSENVLGAMVQVRNRENQQEVKLSQREKEVLRLIAQGKTSQQIADDLFLARLTVETHRKNIKRKLGIKSTAALVKYAMDQMLI